jgi:hypothetical protein
MTKIIFNPTDSQKAQEMKELYVLLVHPPEVQFHNVKHAMNLLNYSNFGIKAINESDPNAKSMHLQTGTLNNEDISNKSFDIAEFVEKLLEKQKEISLKKIVRGAAETDPILTHEDAVAVLRTMKPIGEATLSVDQILNEPRTRMNPFEYHKSLDPDAGEVIVPDWA